MNNKISVVVAFLFLLMFIIWSQIKTPVTDQENQPTVINSQSVPIEEKKIPEGDVIRKTRVQRGGDFTENIFYVGEVVIAAQKVYVNGTIEETDQIPDGKVKFEDEYEQTYGEEYYENGKKHGSVTVYYNSGKLKSEQLYQYGQLMKNKEYYENGSVRFEVDYSNAITGIDQKESGIGKLYYPNGLLKYEWNHTTTQNEGYKRSYNQDGTLRAESKFDSQGHFIENSKIQAPPQEL